MARTLAERQRALEQNKARLLEQEGKIKLAERKARTRRLAEAGALVEKAGLLELGSNALYGALLSLQGGTGDAAQLDKWATLGGRSFDREARARDEGKEAVLLTFKAVLDKDATTALRKAGFRFSKVLRHWEGLARFDEATALAKAHKGTARRVGGNGTGAPADGGSPDTPDAAA